MRGVKEEGTKKYKKKDIEEKKIHKRGRRKRKITIGKRPRKRNKNGRFACYIKTFYQ